MSQDEHDVRLSSLAWALQHVAPVLYLWLDTAGLSEQMPAPLSSKRRVGYDTITMNRIERPETA
jgi:hypothetical protein